MKVILDLYRGNKQAERILYKDEIGYYIRNYGGKFRSVTKQSDGTWHIISEPHSQVENRKTTHNEKLNKVKSLCV